MTDTNVSLTIPELTVPRIPVQGETTGFPVRRIWCVGRNYAEHTREMGGNPDRESPFFFAKPADSIVPGGGQLSFPRATMNLQYEVELAVAIAGCGVDLQVGEARDLIFGYAVALDMTRRDLQAEAKRTSRPWDVSKGFDQSCPISPIIPVTQSGYLDSGSLTLEHNGQTCQSADLSEMIWNIEECIAALSGLVELRPGDFLLTGTPAGVGSVSPGDTLIAKCDHVGQFELRYLD